MKPRNEIEFTDENIRSLFGYEDAEGEPVDRLKEFFFKSKTYKQIMSDLPIRLLVGHKGVGKSAMFRIAMAEQKSKGELTILIRPDDIAEVGEKHENILLSINKWKYGLTEIIAEKVLREFGIHDATFRGKIIQYGMKIISLIADTAKPYLADKVSLAPSQKALLESFSASKKIIVYLDDLDRGWQNKRDGIVMISALLNAIRDLSYQNSGLYFKVSLRSDVYAAIRLEDESSDKISGNVIWQAYSLHEIFVMLIMRIKSFFGESFDEQILMKNSQYQLLPNLEKVISRVFTGEGNWENTDIHKVILSLIRKRPRDLVKLCSLAAREAYSEDSKIITTKHFKAIFEAFSQEIIHDTIIEFKSELSDVKRLIFGMKPSKKTARTADSFIYTTSELRAKVNNIMQGGNFRFADGKIATAQELMQFLYKINFLTARKVLDDGTIQRKYFEENNYLSTNFVDFGYDWEVHLAYRWALQPDTLESLLLSYSNK